MKSFLQKNQMLLVIVGVSVALMSCFTSCHDSDISLAIPKQDAVVLEKIALMGTEANVLWPGYDFVFTQPIYLVLRDDDGSNARGYFINPKHELASTSHKVDEAQSASLEIYADDSYLNDAAEILGEDGAFSFVDLSIDGSTYMLVRSKPKEEYTFYDQFKDFDNSWIVLLTIHEAFHINQINSWTFPPDASQEFANYPLTLDVLTYELGLFNFMIDTYSITQTNDAKQALKKYVVLFEKLTQVDQTSNFTLTRMANLTQFIEGSARYVEHFSALNSIYPGISSDPTHGWKDRLYDLNTGELIRHVFAMRTWYHVGAGAIHLLKLSGVAVDEKLEQGNNVYQLASELANLSPQEKAEILNQIEKEPNWQEIQSKALYLHGLL